MSLTREEFDSLWLQGPDAVFAQLELILSRLTQLEEQVAKNSGNSSKPPSSDGLSKKPLEPMTTSLRKKSGKKVGGQPRHAGSATLEQVAEPDQIVAHHPDVLPFLPDRFIGFACGGGRFCRRQVFEMPEPKIVVTEHQAVCVTCPGCGKACRASFPEAVTQPVQYGPHLLGFATYLHAVHLLPFARCAQVVQEVTGAPFCVGSLAHALDTAHQALEPFEATVKAALSQVAVQHVDETGSRVSGQVALVPCALYTSDDAPVPARKAWRHCHRRPCGLLRARWSATSGPPMSNCRSANMSSAGRTCCGS